MLTDRNIVLGITGSIAAYKAVALASRLTQAGARVDVIMTEAATRFVAPLTFQTITQRPVTTDMFRLLSEMNIAHVALADRAEVVVIAPATANTIAKLACGLADDMLSATVLATRAPVVIAPAMDAKMYENPITQENIARLRRRGIVFVEPAYGRLASGAMGRGRLAKMEDIVEAVQRALAKKRDLEGKVVVVTAGGTQEPIDPVRFIANRSSGKMGYALAEAARDRGASVTLISAPTNLAAPPGVELVAVRTALAMKAAVEKAAANADILIMAAAVADYRAAAPAQRKIKADTEGLILRLEKNPDILASVTKERLCKVGFAAETEDLVANARAKLQEKGLWLIVANDVSAPGSGFGSDTNQVTLLDDRGGVTALPLMSKREVADRVLDKIVELGEQV